MFKQIKFLWVVNIVLMQRSKMFFKCQMHRLSLHFVPHMVEDDGIKVQSPFCQFENPSCMHSSSLVGTNVNYLSPPSAFIICNVSFTTILSRGHNLWLAMSFTPKHVLIKRCQLNLTLLPHNFSQHGHLYLGWSPPWIM